jgi:hypothetical protein
MTSTVKRNVYRSVDRLLLPFLDTPGFHPMPGAPPTPIAHNLTAPARTGRVKGGSAAERREGTLDAPEHAGILALAMGDDSNHRRRWSL